MLSKIIRFIKNKPYWFVGIIIIIGILITLIITLPIVLINNNVISDIIQNTTLPTQPEIPTIPSTPTSPVIPSTSTTPAIPIPTDGIVGAWTGTVGCGDGAFNIISLGSALPQDYNTTSLNNFFSKIVGNFDSNLSKGKTKYLISVGGSFASVEGWNDFLTQLTNNTQNLQNFIIGCKSRGIVGIDFDLEGTTKAMIPTIINLVNQIKSTDPNFIVMHTILLGSPDTYADLLNTSNYDYLSLMLYNGGMYQAGGAGAGCDWDGWAELFLSKGTAGCQYPLRATCITNPLPDCNDVRSTFALQANLSKIDPSKVLLGLIIDTSQKRLTPEILERANQLNKQYGGAGIMIWVLPGWVTPKDNITQLNAMGFNIDPSKC